MMRAVAARYEAEDLLPAQLQQVTRLRLDPHRALRLAVLEDAIHILRFRRAKPPLLADTLAWVRSDGMRWPMSFLRVCDALDLAPEPIRRLAEHYAALPVLPPITGHGGARPKRRQPVARRRG